jgi:hypothetical protein
MNTQKLIALTAGAVFLFGAAAANAANTVSYSFGSSNLTPSGASGPGFQDIISNPFNEATTAATEFVQVNPGSCPSCSATNILSEDVAVTFTVTGATNGSGASDNQFTVNGMYYANYDGDLYNSGANKNTGSTANNNIGCNDSDEGQNDCIVWDGTTGNASITADLSGSNTLTISLTEGQDWDISNDDISLLMGTTGQQTGVPEPASMVLFASSLLGLPVIRRLRRKPAASTTAAA